MLKIEIASYPKSGNTWFRNIAQNYLTKLQNGEKYPVPTDIHEQQKEVIDSKGIYIKSINEDLLIYKSHLPNNPKVNPDKIIHIYRHPLDVFLSTLNSLFHSSNKFRETRLKDLFLNGVAKSVESIASDQEMDWYFEQFLDEAGSRYWPVILGEKSNYFKYVMTTINKSDTISIKYEDLLTDTCKISNQVFQCIWSNNPYIPIDVEQINDVTKNSQDKKFYWKSVAKNYETFLTEKQITSFNIKYDVELKKLGYL